jgi:hypothetical protein
MSTTKPAAQAQAPERIWIDDSGKDSSFWNDNGDAIGTTEYVRADLCTRADSPRARGDVLDDALRLLREIRQWLIMPSADGVERTAWPERVAQIDAVLNTPRPTTAAGAQFKPMCDDPECWVCKRMAELHAENSTTAAGALTVEQALAELREMFPHSWFQLTINANYDRNSYKLRMPNFKDVKELTSPTLEDLVDAVRAWAKSRAEESK